MTEEVTKINKTAEEWVAKLRYSRSFMAKLLLSEPKVKEYYAALVTALMKYEKVRSHLNWSGVSFSAGKKSLLKLTIVGKTLTAYYALDPNEFSLGKYRLRDVSDVKKYRLTPGKIRITSPRALSFGLRLVEALAFENSLYARVTPCAPVQVKDFPADSFQNLLARGLIRLLKVAPQAGKGELPQGSMTLVPSDNSDLEVKAKEVLAADGEEGALKRKIDPGLADAYRDTVETSTELVGRHERYEKIMDAVLSGQSNIRCEKKKIVTAIDESWVTVIEDCMQALDEVTRNPMHFIEETEEILPIERTKKVTQRSIQHLSQHSGLISRIEGETIIPSKLLNIFRDDSLMTYENKFVNTLLQRLYDFVTVRYEGALEGADKETTTLDFDEKVEFESATGKVTMHIELERPQTGEGKNYVLQSDLWKRVTRLYEMVTDYQKSAFVAQMGNAYIRPPVMRTNAILKNKNLVQCLALWEFIEGYEDKEGIVADRKEWEAEEEYLTHIYRTTAQQLLAFQHNAELSGDLKAKKKKVKKETLVKETTQPEQTEDDLIALEAALAADLVLDEMSKEERERKQNERMMLLRQVEPEEEPALEPELPKSVVDTIPVTLPEEPLPPERPEEKPEIVEATEEPPQEAEEAIEEEEEEEGFPGILGYHKSLQAKLLLADQLVKERYVAIYNHFVSKEKVRARMSYDHVAFSASGKVLARMTIIGKTLRVYYALDVASMPSKYFLRDASRIKKYAMTPALLFVRGSRSLSHALELVDLVCEGLGKVESPNVVRVEDYPRKSVEELLEAGLIQRVTPRKKSPFIGKVAPLTLQKTKPDADYRKEYQKEAKELLKKEKPGKGKTISLEGVVEPTEIWNVLQNTDAQLEKERQEKMEKEAAAMPTVTEGGGDALLMRKEAMISADEEQEPVIPEVKKAPVKPVVVPVPVGGDALTPKPITMDEIERYEQSAAQAEEYVRQVKKEEPKKLSFWQRLRKKK